jgi:hypothetical protein
MSAATLTPAGLSPARVACDEAARARRLRGDLRFLRVYALTTKRVMRYRPHADAVTASEAPGAIAERIEAGLAGEARRYRLMGWCVVAVIVGPVLLSGFLRSAMYWLPVSIYWWPFARGNYSLPYLSLFEWLSYPLIVAYFAVAWGLLAASHAETRKLGTEYRRLADAPAANSAGIADALADGGHPRAQFVVRHSPPFSAYVELMDWEER